MAAGARELDMASKDRGPISNVGEKIRQQRLLARLRIVDLAEKVSMSPSYISQVERRLTASFGGLAAEDREGSRIYMWPTSSADGEGPAAEKA